MPEGATHCEELLGRAWAEAEVVAMPVRDPGEPVVLVRRRPTGLMGPGGEDLVVCQGYPTISLFTGCGGMDLGLEQAGFTTLVQHEWDAGACETLMANRPRAFRYAALIQGDIFRTPTSLLLGEANLRVGEPYLLCGGPPCQGFSTANSKAWAEGRLDPRNDLVFEFLRVVREAQPRFFVFENVPGFLAFNKGAYFRAFLEMAYGCYYELVYGLIDAVNYGVPQRRTRFICSGTRRDLAEIDGHLAALPKPTHFEEERLGLLRAVDGSPLFSEEREWLTHAPGIRYFADREVLRPPMPNREGRQTKVSVEFYRRLRREEPDRLVEVAR